MQQGAFARASPRPSSASGRKGSRGIATLYQRGKERIARREEGREKREERIEKRDERITKREERREKREERRAEGRGQREERRPEGGADCHAASYHRDAALCTAYGLRSRM